MIASLIKSSYTLSNALTGDSRNISPVYAVVSRRAFAEAVFCSHDLLEVSHGTRLETVKPTWQLSSRTTIGPAPPSPSSTPSSPSPCSSPPSAPCRCRICAASLASMPLYSSLVSESIHNAQRASQGHARVSARARHRRRRRSRPSRRRRTQARRGSGTRGRSP